MSRITKRRWFKVLLVVAGTVAVGGLALLRYGVMHSGSKVPVEPFRIAGNLYYVGAADVTAFLLTGREGHVVIDGGYPRNAPTIIAGIAKLGFKVTDVKVLVNSHAHLDHAGGLKALQEASDAKLWVSERDADFVAHGGAGLPSIWPVRFLEWTGLLRFPAPHIDHTFKDGDTIRVGPVELVGNVTAGHTPGCTSWSFTVRDGDRELRAVNICSLTLQGASLVEPEAYPGIRADFEHSFRTLRSLRADIFLATHTEWFSLQRKLSERATAQNPADPFIDPDGYIRFVDSAEQDFRELLAKQQRRP